MKARFDIKCSIVSGDFFKEFFFYDSSAGDRDDDERSDE